MSGLTSCFSFMCRLRFAVRDSTAPQIGHLVRPLWMWLCIVSDFQAAKLLSQSLHLYFFGFIFCSNTSCSKLAFASSDAPWKMRFISMSDDSISMPSWFMSSSSTSLSSMFSATSS
uniref:(northern house mosquito) hypothetical protein n=1 Tax=Culex pipiens TaxID=7175 RepID=A0A8D8B9A5_CULPI